MEEIIGVIIQLVLEVGFQALVSGGFDLAATTSRGRGSSGCGWLTFQALIGGLCGWLSTLLFPNLMLPFAWMRVANLILAPFAAGLLTLFIDHRFNHGKDGQNAFWHGFTFALLFGLARFAFGAK